MQPGNINHHFGAGVYVKEMHVAAGEQIIKHAHTYDHLSFLVSGSVTLFREGYKPQELTGPCSITTPAGVHHGVRALTDAVWLCIHPVNEQNVPVIEPDEPQIDGLIEAMAEEDEEEFIPRPPEDTE
jgi:quercetin dioxygenase-like cupin family protein